MNLWQKIIEVRKSVNSLTKDVDKDGLKYTYVSGNQILGKIKTMMDEKGIILQPSIELGSHEQYDYTTQYGKEMTDFIVKGEMSYTWINAEQPDEREIVRWAYYGQQSDISKALGSGLTYSERYFLLKYFGLPTDEDDPDAKQGEENKSKNKTNVKKGLSEGQVKRLFAIAIGKGYDGNSVKKTAKAKYNVDVLENMTKTQYNEIVKGYEDCKHK